MKTALVAALTESCGYLKDQGWHQTAQLMTLAAQEIEHLTARVRELEGSADIAHPKPANEGAQTLPFRSVSRGTR